MPRFGANPHEMREMDQGDVLSVRFRLLIIMMKACLDDCPMGSFRRAAIIRSSQALEKGRPSLLHAALWPGQFQDLQQTPDGVQVFDQRLKLLTTMAKAFAGGYPIGVFRKLAIKKTLLAITRAMGVHDEVTRDRSGNVA